ncbi:MAG TPA: sugar transferase [Opitutaceae bacterium]|jgi:lipopolysaccharide/colanic/teichoic acid biosynthesis glycosyltransferase
MTINRNRRSAILLLAMDLASIAVLFNLLFWLRGTASEIFLWPVAAPAAVFVVSIHLISGYGARTDMLSLDYASLHLIASMTAAVATIFLAFAFIPPGFELQSSRGSLILGFFILGGVTLAYRRYLYARSATSRGELNLVFVGTAADFSSFKAECQRMGTLNPLVHADTAAGSQALEAVLDSIARGEVQVEAVILRESAREFTPDTPMKLVQLYFSGVPTYTLELFHQAYWEKIPLYRINSIWLFQEGFQIAREPVFERIKRFSDIVFASVGLVLAAIPVALAAAAIKLDDGGPVFFVQTRIGRHKRPFALHKLRTMRAAASPGDPYTRQGDSRITRMGRLLRAGRLDELPQLWNVLVGDMSLIGPRAEWDRLVDDYEKQIPSYHFRHLVKPGITGLAQVNYRYGTGIEDTLRKLEYDLYYIRNFSFMLDASIVLKTLHVMILRKGH